MRDVGVFCLALGLLGCRDPRPSSGEAIPSATVAAAPSVSVAPVVSADVVLPEEGPQPIGGIVRSPMMAEPAASCPKTGEFPQVITRDGNIILCVSAEKEEVLTSTEHDGLPSLSPKRDAVVFLRAAGTMKVSLGGGDFAIIHDNRVFMIRLQDRKEQEIGRADEKEACLSLSNPSWLDDDAVLVQANGYEASTIHNLSACLIDVRLRKIFLVARRTSCAVLITAGRFKGNLFVAPWDFQFGSGLIPWFGVVNRRGKRIHSFEENPLLRDWTGDGAIMNEEMSPECLDLSAHRGEVEQIMKKW